MDPRAATANFEVVRDPRSILLLHQTNSIRLNLGHCHGLSLGLDLPYELHSSGLGDLYSLVYAACN